MNQQDHQRKLPEGWRWTELGVLYNLVNGDAYKETDWSQTGVPIIRIQNLNDPAKPFNYWNGPTDDLVSVKSGNLLLAWSGTPGTSFGAHLWNREPGVLNQHIFRLDQKNDCINSEWAVSAINHQLAVLIGKAHGGVGLRHVTKSVVQALKIPVPSLAEQRRIVAILNEQMGAVERARAAAEAQLEAAKALPATYLRYVFNSPEAQKWLRKRLGEVCEINPRRPELGRPDEAPTTFVPMEAVDHRLAVVVRPETRPYGEVRKGYTYFAEGDVLFAKITPCMQNGKHAIARGLIEGVGFGSTEFHVLRPTAEITSEWIHFFLRQPWVLHAATAYFEGAVGQQRVPSDFLFALEIPLVPLPEQRRIVAILNEQMAEAERARKSIEEELDTINKLPAALLRRAFNGEL